MEEKLPPIRKKIGYLPQEISFQDQDTIVLDYLSSARPIEKLENKLNTIYEKLPNASEKEQTKLLHQAETIQNELDSLHQYSAEDELLSIIDNMKIEIRLTRNESRKPIRWTKIKNSLC